MPGKSLLENVELFGPASELQSFGGSSAPLVAAPQPQQQQSVPLYRRQAGQNYQSSSSGTLPSASNSSQSIASSTPDLLDNHLQQSLFETLEGPGKLHHSNAMLFGGQFGGGGSTTDQSNNLQGFTSIHNIAAGLMQQQHNLNNREFLHQLQQQQQQQQQQQHLHDGRGGSSVEELLNRQAANQTYASVLSQGGGKQKDGSGGGGLGGLGDGSGAGSSALGDPFAALRDLGRKSNGYYNYFHERQQRERDATEVSKFAVDN
ncbi:hypothetical protein pipiens_017609 [Culex pipiens pipiens]|uniref:Uncharacterized protein n=1 Tax=Culex pipiens pipiens TaxID=38569 RepID=A0ABD1CFZ7_CULPP